MEDRMKREKSCGAVLHRVQDGEEVFLLIQHKNGGHWAFPKGHVEKDETELQTALREIREETGYEAEIDSRFREVVSYSPKEGVMKDVVYFSGKVLSGEEYAQPEEVLHIRWETAGHALQTLTYANDRQILQKLVRYLIQNANKGDLK